MAMSEETFRDSLRRLRASGDTTTFEGMDPEGEYPMVTPNRLIDCVIDGEGYVDRKMNAMKAHATQITVDGPFFALSNNNGHQIWGSEHYRLVKGTAAPGPDGREHDLFAGL
jgi:N-acetyl-1-D-myo-inositol-2-amino-2-deoxy-alpha-D-glucopyranoside deacetylase